MTYNAHKNTNISATGAHKISMREPRRCQEQPEVHIRFYHRTIPRGGGPKEGAAAVGSVRVQAMENRQLSAAIAAIKEIGVLSGLRIERREWGWPGEFAEVSTEQLVSELRDLGIEVKFH